MRQKSHRTGLFGRLAALAAALLLALAMVPMAAVPAAADTLYTITITGTPEKHTYKAYQIFSGTLGTLDSSGKIILSDIEWGKGVSTDGQTGLQDLYGVKSAEGVADALDQTTTSTTTGPTKPDDFSQLFAANASWLGTAQTTTSDRNSEGNYILSVPSGYYLIVDTTDDRKESVDAYTRFFLQVSGDVSVNRKTDVPTVEKKVKDQELDGTSTGWQDSADYDIGDSVPFNLTAVLPNDYKDYKNGYYLQFVDVMDPGLTPDLSTIHMYVEDKDHTTRLNGGNSYDKSYYTTAWDKDKNILTITIKDLKELKIVKAGMSVSFEYSAVLNEKAVIGKDGNANRVYLKYSNDSNTNQSGRRGQTPEDKVKVFTYGLKISKVDEKNNALSGASFKLEHEEPGPGSTTVYNTVSGPIINGNTFTWNGLDAGVYRLTETVAPNGYNKLTGAIEFTITAEHDVLADDPQLTKVVTSGTNGYQIAFTWDGKSLTATVQNKKGGTLPSTGGRGTQLFYLVGGILVAVAGLTLIARRRSRRREK